MPQDTSGCGASASRALPQGCQHNAGPQRRQAAEEPCVARLGPVRRSPPSPFFPSPSPPRLPSRHDEAKEKLNPANSHPGLQARRCVGVCMLTPSQRASASVASKKLTMRARSDQYKNHLRLFQGSGPQHLQRVLSTTRDQAPNLTVVKVLRLQGAFAPVALTPCQSWLVRFLPDLHFREPRRNPSKLT